MKAGWQLQPLGQACKLLNGRAYKKSELLSEGPTPVLRVGNFFTNRNWYYSDLELDENKYCDDGDLLYAWSASFGPRIWEGGKVIYHYHIWKMLPNSELLDKKYLYHFLDWDKENIKASQGAGTTMIHVTKGSMEARSMPIPPLEEQCRIVAVLDKAFAAIATATANAEKNLTNARALFESYLDSEFCNADGQWVSKRLRDVATLQRGFDLPKRLREDGLVPLVSSSGISAYVNKAKVKGPGVTTGRSGSIGNVFYIEDDFWPLNTSLYIKEFHDNDPKFVFWLLKKFDLSKFATGAGVPTLNRNFVHDELVSLPTSKTAQRSLVARLELLDCKRKELVAIYNRKLAALSELKQSLLQKAFAGELT